MEETGRILLRRSIHTFLTNYQYFTTTSALLAFPFSAAFLIIQSLLPSSPILLTFHHHINSLFQVAGFPPSQLFIILNFKISQTTTSSIFLLPFSLSFLLISKASIIQSFKDKKNPSFSLFLSIYNPILLTQICNFFIILSANSTCFSLLFIAFNSLEDFGYSSTSSILFLSGTGAVLYSIVIANSFIVCNLALISSGMDKIGGYFSILKACVLMKDRTTTALSIAIPVSMALAAVEALFQYRVVRDFDIANPFTALEGIFIAYLYSIVVVIDTIVSCELYKSCRREFWIDEEEGYAYPIQIQGHNGKIVEELP